MANLEDVTIPVERSRTSWTSSQQLSGEVSGVTGKGIDYLRDALVFVPGRGQGQAHHGLHLAGHGYRGLLLAACNRSNSSSWTTSRVSIPRPSPWCWPTLTT
ncbi:MAG: hypothetical protein MZU91_02985 [Desulfosudis oleivorans]|nr:hypothetical protein [Desulfosudis oleivorans]